MRKVGYWMVFLAVATMATGWVFLSISQHKNDPSAGKPPLPNTSETQRTNPITESKPSTSSHGKAAPAISPATQEIATGQPIKTNIAHQTHPSLKTPGRPLQGEASSPSVSNPASSAMPAATGQEPAEVAWFKNPSIPLKTRQAEIRNLATQADSRAQQTLMSIGNAEIYLNREAVEALGAFAQSPDKQAVAAYLREKMGSQDSQMACAAANGYARLMGDEGVAELAMALNHNRERPDGHQELVQTSIVIALGEMASATAVEPLKAELGRSDDSDWRMDYGSEVVKALRRLATEDGRKAMLAYADRLAARIPSEPMAKQYFEAKISEARTAAGQ